MISSAESSSRRPTTTTALVVAFLCVCVLPKAALAQGLPMFADPINTKALMQYADRLELSVDQRLGLEPLHDAYLDRFRRLRDRDMQDFQDHMIDIAMSFMRNRFAIPPRTELEQLVQEFQQVESKIEAVDRSLFNELEALLDDQQHLKLQRVRKQRRIDAFRTMVLEIGREFNPGARADLVELVEGLDLSADELALANPILVDHETALLRRARSLYSVLKAATTEILDTIDELGLRDMSPEEMMQIGGNQEFMEALQIKFDEASVQFQKAIHDISQLNLRTTREIMKVLDDDNSNELRDRYYESVYQLVYANPGSYRRRYDEALRIEDIDPELIEQLKLQRDEFIRQDDKLIDELVDVVEESREYRTMAILNEDETHSLYERLGELPTRRVELLKRADATLEALIGAELFAQNTEQLLAAQQDVQQKTGQPPFEALDGESPEGIESHAEQTVKDPRLPNPISAGDFKRFTRVSGMGVGDTAVLDLLYQDYREDFDSILYTPVTGEEQTEADEPEPDEVQLLQQQFIALQQTDTRFFDDVAIMTVDQQQSKFVERFRLLRERGVHHEVTNAYGPSWGDRERVADLVQLVYEADLDQSTLQTIGPVLDSYETEASPIYKERLDMAKSAKRRLDAARRAGDSSASPGVGEAIMEKWRQEQRGLTENRRRISNITEEHLEKVLNQMSPVAAQQLRFTYNREAFPDMYRDSIEIERSIASILKVPNLSDSQRTQIDGIAKKFRSRFMELSNQGITLRREQEDESGDASFRMPSRRMLERELQRERLKFDRDEVCARAMMHLRLAISESQAEYLPQRKN